MKRLTLVALLAAPVLAVGTGAAAAASSDAPQAPLVAGKGQVVEGEYVVTLKSGSTGTVTADASVPRGDVTHEYKNLVKGFSARLDGAELDEIRSDPNVAQVEQVTRVSTADTQPNPPSWGQDRVDQADLPLDTNYTYNTDGAGVTAYVIDTGIEAGHPDFGDRASLAFDATGGDGVDCNGHGTHVAGTIGGTEHGLAKGVTLAGVRVLDCQGSGTTDDVVAGMDWVAANAAKPAVANMSLGGGQSAAIDQAAANLMSSGVYLAVAAGNESSDACSGSPSGADGVMTVAASDDSDTSADFTNFGSCVEIYAPGVDITSAWIGGGTDTISGTSMATPHVVGVAALYKAANGDADEATISEWLTSNAVADKVTGAPAGTPNLLLQTAGL
ncbi:MAG: S8 family serine peptidase [Streptosporangiales bacterium]|nr:S8 family serine peptidase [Streptosporangiales bacterium]